MPAWPNALPDLVPRRVAELERASLLEAELQKVAERTMADSEAPPTTFPPAMPDSEPSPATRLGNRAGALPVPPAGGVEPDPVVVPEEPPVPEPEPLRNQRNYRIIDADNLGA